MLPLFRRLKFWWIVLQTRRENCQRAQAQVAGFQSGTRIATLNAKGEREFMDDATRAAELQRLQTIVQQNCGAAADAQ